MNISAERDKTWKQLEDISVDLIRSIMRKEQENVKDLVIIIQLLTKHLEDK